MGAIFIGVPAAWIGWTRTGSALVALALVVLAAVLWMLAAALGRWIATPPGERDRPVGPISS